MCACPYSVWYYKRYSAASILFDANVLKLEKSDIQTNRVDKNVCTNKTFTLQPMRPMRRFRHRQTLGKRSESPQQYFDSSIHSAANYVKISNRLSFLGRDFLKWKSPLTDHASDFHLPWESPLGGIFGCFGRRKPAMDWSDCTRPSFHVHCFCWAE